MVMLESKRMPRKVAFLLACQAVSANTDSLCANCNEAIFAAALTLTASLLLIYQALALQKAV